ncbi:MAG: hypothetical protein IJ532_04950 [Alphaproteobacteria bacterium]|nr:hypothetical protein [Alphaproteobacteria bacterium]
MFNNTVELNKKIRMQIGHELWLARQEKHLYIYQVAKHSRVPIDLIDIMELGKAIDVTALKKLLKFYGKQIKICFK